MRILHLKNLFLTLLFVLVSHILVAQTEKEDDGTYFWFNVRLLNSVNKITHVKEYSLRLVSTSIYNGSLKQFQKQLWAGTVSGQKISVGPFPTFESAKEAVNLYKMVNDTVTQRGTQINRYWFLLKVNIMERSHSYQFERMAARVASGSCSDFSAVLRESLTFKTLAIGPFDELMDAERSKQLYRIEE